MDPEDHLIVKMCIRDRLKVVEGAVKEGNVWQGIETFTIVYVEELDRPVSAQTCLLYTSRCV